MIILGTDSFYFSYNFNGLNIYRYHRNSGLLLNHYRYSRGRSYIGKTSYAYNQARQLTRVTHYGNSRYSYRAKARYYYRYDGNGNRTRIISQIPGNTEYAYYTYDGLDRLTRVEYKYGKRNRQTEEYTYDTGGNRIRLTTHKGTTTYSGDNRLLSKTTPDNKTTDYQYDKAGNLKKETHPDNTIEYSYNEHNLLTQY